MQHIHGWLPGTQAEVETKSNDVIRAYEDIGMRVSYCYAVRDQNRLVYQDDAAFVASLPTELRGPMQAWFDRFQMTLDGCMDLFGSLHGGHAGKERVKIQLAPANPALVLRLRADPAGRGVRALRRAIAHAPGGDGVSEGLRP